MLFAEAVLIFLLTSEPFLSKLVPSPHTWKFIHSKGGLNA